MPRLYIKQLGSRSYANYSKDALQECMEAVRSGMPKTTASKTFGIPLRTLSNKIKGIYTKKAGGQTVFLLEEQAFVSHLLKLAEFGFPVTNDDLRHVVGNYLNKKGRIVKKFKNNIPGNDWFEGGPPGCRYNRTKHGWFDSSTFEDWFTSHMLPVPKKQEGQKVLIGDNLSSHFNETVIELCEANNIRFVCLPPNTTHLTQPLDVSVFSSLKNEWRKVLSHWRDTSEGMHYHT